MSDTHDNIESSRADKLRHIENLGLDPWGGRFDDYSSIQELRDGTVDDANRPRVRAAGRIVLRRPTGKAHFLEIRDWSGRRTTRTIKSRDRAPQEYDAWSSYIQVMIGQKEVGPEGWALAQELDYGDLLGVDGALGKTRTGELTIFADKLTFLGKSLLPHPDKWSGLQDVEYRLRHRYLDLLYSPEVMERALKRVQVIRTIRRYLDDRGYWEVETPVLHAIAGGAAARPFITHHNALDIDLYLRIALELYLKRLLVGGIDKVYEIGRVFRNEGIDARHNPEFTMLELYQSYGDYRTMMDLTEGLIVACVDEVVRGDTSPARQELNRTHGPRHLPYGGGVVNYEMPWERASYAGLFARHVGVPMTDEEGVRRVAEQSGFPTAGKDLDVVIHHLFEERVERHLVGPVFVYDYPAALCPLTKRKRGEPRIAERFELYIQGMEVANAYTELNDPVTQEQTFRTQLVGLPDEESMAKMDEDFVRALRHGMPPAGGLGIGIDRLVMLLTDTQNIRDIILFPLLRPEQGDAGARPAAGGEAGSDVKSESPAPPGGAGGDQSK